MNILADILTLFITFGLLVLIFRTIHTITK